MTTESSSSRSSSTADSYIGSLISLTSKSEIRYEGILYDINTEESSIGLRNVRSFGTEGRKKDGPPVPPSDKVYEYILFRGSDIKDLQVKQSPSAQPTAPINNDPAIIQSHYPRPVTTSASVPSAATGSLTDINSHSPQMALPGSNFQAGVPLYQPPGGSIGSWGASPPPTANGSGLAMPMYWPGYYPSPNGLPHIPQQSLLRPPPGLSVPPTMQQQMQYPNFNISLSSGASNVPDVPSPLLPASSVGHNVSSVPLTSSTLQSIISPIQSATLPSDPLPSSMPNKAPISALPAVSLNASLPTLPPLMTSTPEISTIMPSMASKPIAIAGSSLHHQNAPLSAPSNLEISKSAHAETVKQTPAPTPSLVTPGQLLQSGPTTVPSPQPTQAAHKDVEVVQVASSSPEPAAPVEPEVKPPILPLPPPARTVYKNGIPYQHRHGHRGGYERGRGTGSSRQVTKFTEEFDFTAMNEKFKKDEVWGHLGKSNKSHAKDKDGDGNVTDEDDYPDEDPADFPKFEVKPSYNKDDFFDSLSSNALDNESHSGRTRYSEQMKIDSETFGEFSRYRGGRGGRFPGRGGRFRGGYYGRGYGYAGRGRGRSTYNYNRAS